MHIRPPKPTELESIEATRRAYRSMWAKLKNVPHRTFDGSREDIDALDFIDYEAGHHPEGLAGAAVMWGGVLAATGVLSWAIGDEQHFVLLGDPNYPKALVYPYARIAEINHSSVPQFGKYEWLLEEAVLRLTCLGFSELEEAKLRALLDVEPDGFFDFAKRGIDRLSKDPRRRAT
jgi:hypothetical protein